MTQFGTIAALPLEILHSANGFYIGTFDEDGPVSRESVEYYETEDAALYALENNLFTQRLNP
ncbi:hypothetical protein [Neisseria sp. Ec49-e6-T10]|uniref:hypothetical protein n=1 Tax=Neisseria sp. Ec49-e6-T10 TaxID=3140744 RepID=UPI003EB7EC9D